MQGREEIRPTNLISMQRIEEFQNTDFWRWCAGDPGG
jgi:hypothetical protein